MIVDGKGAAIEWRDLIRDLTVLGLEEGKEPRLGVDPLANGVEGGRRLSNCSGLKLGPKDTRFRLALMARTLSDCLFCPRGLFLAEAANKIG